MIESEPSDEVFRRINAALNIVVALVIAVSAAAIAFLWRLFA